MGGIALQFGQNTQRIAPQVKQRQANPHNENEHLMLACKHALRCNHFADAVLLKYGSMRFWHIGIQTHSPIRDGGISIPFSL